MNSKPRPSSVRSAAILCLFSAPLLLVGALFSKMDTPERYNIQLAVVGVVAFLSVVSAIASLRKRSWGICMMGLLFGIAAAFWILAAGALVLATSSDLNAVSLAVAPAAIGVLCARYSLTVFQDYQQSRLNRTSPVRSSE